MIDRSVEISGLHDKEKCLENLTPTVYIDNEFVSMDHRTGEQVTI